MSFLAGTAVLEHFQTVDADMHSSSRMTIGCRGKTVRIGSSSERCVCLQYDVSVIEAQLITKDGVPCWDSAVSSSDFEGLVAMIVKPRLD
jgi:hypothetical protein